MFILLELFLTFFKIGLFTFGGGYAMIPLIEDACVEKKSWLSHDDMMNLTVIAESTPGPIAINCATFVGYQQKGLVGSMVSTMGMVLPSFLIICFISTYLDNFLEITIVANAFTGIKIAVGILILDASFKMLKQIPRKPVPCILLVCSFVTMVLIDFLSWNFSSFLMMPLAAVISLVVFIARNTFSKKGGAGK